MIKKRITLIHWKAEEAQEKIDLLTKNGYEVLFDPFTGPATLRSWRAQPPDLFLIDLTRAPSMGRDVAVALRQYKDIRGVPLVFTDGAPDKVEKIKNLLPDAVYSGWENILPALKQAINNPPKDPVKPGSTLAGYAGTPLPRKLGIRKNDMVSCLHAPDNLLKILGRLPDKTNLQYDPPNIPGLLIWFVRSVEELEQHMTTIASQVKKEGVWIAWAKKGSALYNGVTQVAVRRVGLAAGLVDYKICAIDDTWSALKFAKRK